MVDEPNNCFTLQSDEVMKPGLDVTLNVQRKDPQRPACFSRVTLQKKKLTYPSTSQEV